MSLKEPQGVSSEDNTSCQRAPTDPDPRIQGVRLFGEPLALAGDIIHQAPSLCFQLLDTFNQRQLCIATETMSFLHKAEEKRVNLKMVFL